jgi:hypothetical protein
VALIEDLPRPVGLVAASALEPRDNPNPRVFRRAYGVTSRVLAGGLGTRDRAGGGSPVWSDAVRRHYLTYPDDPRYRRLADEITATLTPAQRGRPLLHALATRRWVEKNVIYSRNVRPAEGEDVTAAFLFGDRRGYCVHIAHAMTYLLRAQGIPARVGAGLAAEAGRRGQGSSLLMMSTDAHAWCEIYLETEGWVVVDATPERSEEPPPPPPPADLQRQLGELARREVPRAQEQLDEGGTAGSLGPWLLLACAGFVALLYGVKVWRRLAPYLAGAGRQYRVCYRAVLDRLAELGLTRQFGETREEFAGRLARLAPEFVALSCAHERRAVSGQESHGRGEWLALKDRVLAAFVAKFPVHRRLLGALNPVAWLWAR